MNDDKLDDLTERLPTAELVKIIKSALACGREARPFSERDLLKALTFGAQSTYAPKRGARPAESSSKSGTRRAQRTIPTRRSAHPPPLVPSCASPRAVKPVTSVPRPRLLHTA